MKHIRPATLALALVMSLSTLLALAQVGAAASEDAWRAGALSVCAAGLVEAALLTK